LLSLVLVFRINPERADLFSHFDAAGVVQSDDQILGVMNELMPQAAKQLPTTRGGALDAAAEMLARNLHVAMTCPFRKFHPS
jgi:hypothetical protein